MPDARTPDLRPAAARKMEARGGDPREEDARKAQAPRKGRGAASLVPGRFEKTLRRGEDDG